MGETAGEGRDGVGEPAATTFSCRGPFVARLFSERPASSLSRPASSLGRPASSLWPARLFSLAGPPLLLAGPPFLSWPTD